MIEIPCQRAWHGYALRHAGMGNSMTPNPGDESEIFYNHNPHRSATIEQDDPHQNTFVTTL